MERVFRTVSVVETHKVAAKLARILARAQAHLRSGLIVGLVGELGAGKTTFVQGFVAALRHGSRIAVTSPTFSILHRYPTSPPVNHIDLYRLSGPESLSEIGYHDDVLSDGLTIVEWIDQVKEAAPPSWIEIRLAVLAPHDREILVRGHGDPAILLLRALE